MRRREWENSTGSLQTVQGSSLCNRFSLHATPCTLPTRIRTVEMRCSGIRDGARWNSCTGLEDTKINCFHRWMVLMAEFCDSVWKSRSMAKYKLNIFHRTERKLNLRYVVTVHYPSFYPRKTFPSFNRQHNVNTLIIALCSMVTVATNCLHVCCFQSYCSGKR